jgi:hypothetical protein
MKTDHTERSLQDRRIIGRIFNANLHTDEFGTVANSVKAPMEGDDTFPIWFALTELHEMGATPSLKTAKKIAENLGRDLNATIVTYLQWKKFHGEVA